jgi:phosphohistidine swiveling domain-containing protein
MVAGEIATTPDAAIALADLGHSVVLVRSETSPNDVHGMARAAGLLTSQGGLASHAAVVARGWGIPAVVGASAVLVGDDSVSIAGQRFALGSSITINGSTGEVFDGIVSGASAIVPEAETLRRWAREQGIEIGDGPQAGDTSLTRGTSPYGSPDQRMMDDGSTADRDIVVTTLAIKGYATRDGLAEALFATPGAMGSLLTASSPTVSSSVPPIVPAHRDGADLASRILAADRDRWGAIAARRSSSRSSTSTIAKDVVTAWQLREVDGSQTFNDHRDRSTTASSSHVSRRSMATRSRGSHRSSRRSPVCALSRPSGPGRCAWWPTATLCTSRHRGSRATTPSGSSCTRT